jgi:hypothetical protein
LFGHVECLKYAHTHGCQLTDLIAYFCARSGCLDCLKYVLDHGCTLSVSECCVGAVLNNHYEIFQYLMQTFQGVSCNGEELSLILSHVQKPSSRKVDPIKHNDLHHIISRYLPQPQQQHVVKQHSRGNILQPDRSDFAQ